MTFEHLQKTLGTFNIIMIESEGQEFDSNLH